MCKTHCKSNTTTPQFYGKIFNWVCLSLLNFYAQGGPYPRKLGFGVLTDSSNWRFCGIWVQLYLKFLSGMKYTFEIIRKKKMERSAPIKFQGPLVNKAFHQWPRLTSLQLLKHVILIAKDNSKAGLKLKSRTIKNYKIFSSCLPSYSGYLEIRIKERNEKLSISPSSLKRTIFI